MLRGGRNHNGKAILGEQNTKMSTKQKEMTIDETRKHRSELKKIKTVSRKMEMIADQYLAGPVMIQFCRDVNLYGLWEALMYADNDKLNAEMVEEIVNRI